MSAGGPKQDHPDNPGKSTGASTLASSISYRFLLSRTPASPVFEMIAYQALYRLLPSIYREPAKECR